MDEPTSALDPISTSKIEELATNLKEQYTIIIVTHNMQQALRISDKTAFFLLGELIEYDDTQKLFYQPKEKRTEVRIMRSKFDQQLALLNDELTQMGETCAKAICLAAQALEEQNASTAAPVAELEEQTNEQERSIEALCLKLLLQQQPVARDLRQISAALKMITDMERIGDQAADIAEIIPFFLSHNTFDCTLVCRMAQQASSMVTQSVDAFVRRDVDLARSIAKQDDLVDEDFSNVKQALISAIAREPGQGEVALDLLMIAKYFERIGDHAVNLSEWVEFSVTGVHKHDGVEYE